MGTKNRICSCNHSRGNNSVRSPFTINVGLSFKYISCKHLSCIPAKCISNLNSVMNFNIKNICKTKIKDLSYINKAQV